MGKKPKKPVIAVAPPSGKQPRIAVNPDMHEELKPVWRVQLLDLGGPWGWSRVQAPALVDIQRRLASFETMTWNEIRKQKSCGFISVSAVCKAAQERLMETHQDDTEQLYKLRIDQSGRVWGIRDRNVLKLLWWDPEHEVYPMNLADN
ncbi:MAG: hypothetical protein L0Y66_17950 [Myxococcaceae bacterium]|nr:hypothetical protein [Myxococcaceae bacterium]